MSAPVKTFYSWGRRASSGTRSANLAWMDDALPAGEVPFLPYGLGRSYGDSCLLDHGFLVETRQLNRLISFDKKTGLLVCEAGCSLAQLLEFCVPRGWFIPVTPGTKFVTVGGCVANDVHGKNHHRAGTFGCFVRRIGLRRSDGTVRVCSPAENTGLFRATIGGLGLTGVIVWVELQLRGIRSPLIRQKLEPLHGFDAFFEVARRQEADFEYSVAWLDATHRGAPRGLFIAGNHVEDDGPLSAGVHPQPRFKIPRELPDHMVNAWSLRLLNTGYYLANASRNAQRDVPYNGFFYPLDAVADWNLAYGRKGLIQYQFVVPLESGPEALRETLGKVQSARQASFLTVVKLFGAVESPGLLSFPRPGATICFDLPNLGAATDRLLDDLDRTVFACKGALYPAKDYRMSRDAFERSYPRHAEFKSLIDPRCASTFSRRTGLTA